MELNKIKQGHDLEFTVPVFLFEFVNIRILLFNRGRASEHNVVISTLDDTCRAYYSELCLCLKLGDRDGSAVAHS